MQKKHPENDIFDLEKYSKIAEDTKFLTVDSLDELEAQINKEFKAGDYDEFLINVVHYCSKASQLANLMGKSLEPYYKALNSDYGPSITIEQEMVNAERYYNMIIFKRNVAWVMEAECLIMLGMREKGIASLVKVLDNIETISYKEYNVWRKAQKMLWDQIGYISQSEED